MPEKYSIWFQAVPPLPAQIVTCPAPKTTRSLKPSMFMSYSAVAAYDEFIGNPDERSSQLCVPLFHFHIFSFPFVAPADSMNARSLEPSSLTSPSETPLKPEFV